MLKIGRYGIAFGRTFRVQYRVPMRGQRFLCFWIFKEARPHDLDHKPQFPPNTVMVYEGRTYHYWKNIDPMVDDFDLKQGVDEVGNVKHFPLGTRLVRAMGPYRYCRAGEELKAGEWAYFNPPGDVPRDSEGHLQITKDVHEAFYDNISATGQDGLRIGMPVVDVAPRQYFWLRVEL